MWIVVRLVLLLSPVIALVAWMVWNRRATGSSGAEKTFRFGVVLSIVGAIWTALAPWLVVPELGLLVGIVLMVLGGTLHGRGGRRASAGLD